LGGERPFEREEIRVAIAYNPSSMSEFGYVVDAYRSVLEEEGVPYEVVDTSLLLSRDPVLLAKRVPAVLFPEHVSRMLPSTFSVWLDKYLAGGGSIAAMFDAGVMDMKGFYRAEPIFKALTGINNMAYDKFGERVFAVGYVWFKNDECRERFEIPLGKVDEDGFISGYEYGKLEYPVIRAERDETVKYGNIYAFVMTKDAEAYPAIVLKEHGKGKALYVNLPLGHIKTQTDDFPLRVVLRTFLFKDVGIPHLAGSPYGIGGLVINWHIDDRTEWKWLPRAIKDGCLRTTIQCSLHITAGDFVDIPRDGLGFNACGCKKGRETVKLIEPFGEIGSHGGWGHNWYANKVNDGTFGEKEIEEYIMKNTRCLEGITGKKIAEYSAPMGAFPQPTNTKILERNGFVAYYYTGDVGSAPNRTFVDKKMVSENVIAFPVLPFGKYASLWEFEARANRNEEEVKRFLFDVADYVAGNRTVRLIYSHPHDLYFCTKHNYRKVFREFLGLLEKYQRKGELKVAPMTYFAKFLLRFLKTRYSFKLADGKLTVSLDNQEGLQGIAVAIPKGQYRKPDIEGVAIDEDDLYYYIVIKESVDEKILHVDAI